MCSVHVSDMPEDAAGGDDRTARARIRDAAVEAFAENGVAGTSVRTIATRAGVSAALVIHHFGSKDELRKACDQHVASIIRERKHRAASAGAGLDPLAALREQGGSVVIRYLARTLVDGSPHIAELIARMVDDAVDYMAVGIEAGLMRPTEDLRGRAAVLTLWTLGALALHEHVERLLGVDLLDDPAEAVAYTLPALRILGEGVLTPEAFATFVTAFETYVSGVPGGKETGS